MWLCVGLSFCVSSRSVVGAHVRAAPRRSTCRRSCMGPDIPTTKKKISRGTPYSDQLSQYMSHQFARLFRLRILQTGLKLVSQTNASTPYRCHIHAPGSTLLVLPNNLLTAFLLAVVLRKVSTISGCAWTRRGEK